MEPEKMTSKQAAEYLGVHVRDLKDLAAAGKIEILKPGRGLWGATYVAETVRSYKASLEPTEPPTTVAEAAGALDIQIDQHTEPERVEFDGPAPEKCCGQDGACADCPGPDEPQECCGDPENCDRDCGTTTLRAVPDPEPEDQPTDEAQSFEDYVQERMEQFGQHLAVHLQAIDRSANAQRVYLESMMHAKSSGTEAYRIMAELDRLGVKVGGPEPMGQPVFLAVEDEKLPEDPEIAAMYQVRGALEELPRDAQLRVMQWAAARFGLDKPPAAE